MSFVKVLYCPTSVLNYINCRSLENIKNLKTAPTYFGSRRNHRQGAKVSALLKLQIWFHCAYRYERCQCYGGISRPVVRVCVVPRGTTHAQQVGICRYITDNVHIDKHSGTIFGILSRH